MTIRLVEPHPPQHQILVGEAMGEIRVPVKLTNALDEDRVADGTLTQNQVRTISVDALIDTGAVRSVIPQFVLDQLGVRLRGREVAEYADGRKEIVGLTSSILFEILGRSTADEALVLGDEVLIGQTILEKLDLLADCANRRLIPNPDHPDQPVSKVK
jgi:clan AA aspartic protease